MGRGDGPFSSYSPHLSLMMRQFHLCIVHPSVEFIQSFIKGNGARGQDRDRDRDRDGCLEFELGFQRGGKRVRKGWSWS